MKYGKYYLVVIFIWVFILLPESLQAATCSGSGQFPDRSTQQEVVNLVCAHLDSLTEQLNGREPRVQPLQPERWQRLPFCATGPEVRLLAISHSGKLPLVVSCPDSGNWQHRLSIKVDFTLPVLVASRDVSRGERLSELRTDDVAFTSVKPGFLQKTDKLDGYIASRKITAGTVINENLVKKASVFRRGQPVTIVVQSDTVLLRTNGIALENGHINDIIRVQKENGRTIKCRVMNEVEVYPVAGQ